MQVLRSVVIELPHNEKAFGDEVLSLLAPLGTFDQDRLTFRKSRPTFLPDVKLAVGAVPVPTAIFSVGDERVRVEITNTTGRDKASPEVYKHISLPELRSRLEGTKLARLDHLGFNLPWFDGVHPQLQWLRAQLAACAAYYLFPTGEAWDFVLPAEEAEIARPGDVDLTTERRPKLEIVSFDKTSVPLVQVDCSVPMGFGAIRALFPEGITDEALKNVWVYVDNPYELDLCFVIGEHSERDWSAIFAGHRYVAS